MEPNGRKAQNEWETPQSIGVSLGFGASEHQRIPWNLSESSGKLSES